MGLIEELVGLSSNCRCCICCALLFCAFLFKRIKCDITEIFNVDEFLVIKMHNNLINEFFLNPYKENTIPHHTLFNFQLFEFIKCDGVLSLNFVRGNNFLRFWIKFVVCPSRIYQNGFNIDDFSVTGISIYFFIFKLEVECLYRIDLDYFRKVAQFILSIQGLR